MKRGILNLRSIALLGLFGLAIGLNAQSKLYWSDFSTKKIQSSNMDGTGVTDLVTGLSNPKGNLGLDLQGAKMYWVDAGNGKLQRANLDGSSIETLVTGIGSGGRGLDLDVTNGHV